MKNFLLVILIFTATNAFSQEYYQYLVTNTPDTFKCFIAKETPEGIKIKDQKTRKFITVDWKNVDVIFNTKTRNYHYLKPKSRLPMENKFGSKKEPNPYINVKRISKGKINMYSSTQVSGFGMTSQETIYLEKEDTPFKAVFLTGTIKNAQLKENLMNAVKEYFKDSQEHLDRLLEYKTKLNYKLLLELVEDYNKNNN